MRGTVWFVAVVAALIVLPAHAQIPPGGQFPPTQPRAALPAPAPSALAQIRTVEQAPPALRGRLGELKGLRGAAKVHVGRVSTQAIQSTPVGQPLSFGVSPSESVQARAVAVEKTQQGRLVWRGEVAGKGNLPPGLATLVVQGDDVTGSIRTPDGRLYRLRPLGGGETAIIEMDYNTMPPDHPPEADRPGGGEGSMPRPPTVGGALRPAPGVLQQPGATALPGGDADMVRLQRTSPQMYAVLAQPTIVAINERFRLRTDLIRALLIPNIDLLVLYTPAAETAAGDINSLIELAVAETNDSFAKSNVRAAVRLVGSERVSYDESGRSYGTIMEHLWNPSDGQMDAVHSRRNALKADVVVLIMKQPNYCGMARNLNVGEADAFALVHWDCATGYYSFAHEVGHLVGTAHDRTTHTNPNYAYGHGFRYMGTGDRWRTIMSYNCPGGCPRLQYWSTPLTTYGGVAMGTAAQEDNVRVWNERARTVAAFR